MYIFHRGYAPIHRQSIKNATETRGFESMLKAAIDIIEVNPPAKIVFVSERYNDFEPIVSVARFLTTRGVTNQFALYYNPPKNVDDPMELGVRLTQVMNGELGSDHLFDRFFAYTTDDKPCYSFTFGSTVALRDCPEIARF